MHSPGKSTLRIVLMLVLILIVLLANLLVHEFGHCITMNATDGACAGVYVWPGVKIWPLTEAGEHYQGTWDGYIGAAQFASRPSTEFANGLVFLMGSGTTALLATLALLLLLIFRPGGWLRAFLLIQAICFLDLLFYTILPEWFGWRHFIFLGGDSPEPLEGAVQMGIPQNIFIAGVLLYSLGMSFGWWIALRSKMRANFRFRSA